MTVRRLKMWMVTVAAAVLLLAVPSVHAQGRGPGGGRPGGGMPGGRPGFGGPGRDGGKNNLPYPGASHTESSNGSQGSLHLGPRGRWWDNSGVARSIGLRKDQQKHMDSIFNSSKPALIESYQTLQREESKLAIISKQAHPDQTQLFAAIDSVNQARASLEKVTTQMLLQIRQQMDTEQLGRMESLSDTVASESNR
jgi:hypothetical protein